MKRLFIIIAVLCVAASVVWARPWIATCTFATGGTTCYFDLGELGVSAGSGNATLFIPASGSTGGPTTMSLAVSPDNTTFYTTYLDNATATHTYAVDNVLNKAYAIPTVPGGRYLRYTVADNTLSGKTLRLHGRD
jgi:DNA-binding beta-propeller fold protein YncE